MEPLLGVHATGWSQGDFTAVFPNMLCGGLAHYNSAFLPHSSQFAERHYGLESSADLAGGSSWVAVPGLADRTVASGSETLVFSLSAAPASGTFFRVRVWLQQKE
jgi:hypothetical protein